MIYFSSYVGISWLLDQPILLLNVHVWLFDSITMLMYIYNGVHVECMWITIYYSLSQQEQSTLTNLKSLLQFILAVQKSMKRNCTCTVTCDNLLHLCTITHGNQCGTNTIIWHKQWILKSYSFKNKHSQHQSSANSPFLPECKTRKGRRLGQWAYLNNNWPISTNLLTTTCHLICWDDPLGMAIPEIVTCPD